MSFYYFLSWDVAVSADFLITATVGCITKLGPVQKSWLLTSRNLRQKVEMVFCLNTREKNRSQSSKNEYQRIKKSRQARIECFIIKIKKTLYKSITNQKLYLHLLIQCPIRHQTLKLHSERLNMQRKWTHKHLRFRLYQKIWLMQNERGVGHNSWYLPRKLKGQRWQVN